MPNKSHIVHNSISRLEAAPTLCREPVGAASSRDGNCVFTEHQDFPGSSLNVTATDIRFFKKNSQQIKAINLTW